MTETLAIVKMYDQDGGLLPASERTVKKYNVEDKVALIAWLMSTGFNYQNSSSLLCQGTIWIVTDEAGVENLLNRKK